VGAMVKPQWVCYKLDETIEQPCSDFLVHTLEVCKGARCTMSIRRSRIILTRGECVQPLQSIKLL
jgi:hypothetical protein